MGKLWEKYGKNYRERYGRLQPHHPNPLRFIITRIKTTKLNEPIPNKTQHHGTPCEPIIYDRTRIIKELIFMEKISDFNEKVYIT